MGRDGRGGEGIGRASAMSFFFFLKESVVVNRVKYKYLFNLGGGILSVCCLVYFFPSESLGPFGVEGEG